MNPTDEELLHAFYAGDTTALERLAERQDPLLARIAYLILLTRTGSEVQALGEWDISEIQLYSDDYRVFNSPQWSLNGWPNRWEAPLAFDSNLATRWRTWETARAGMYFEVNLENPQRLTSAVLVSHTPVFRVPLEVYGWVAKSGAKSDAKGGWRQLARDAAAIPRAPQDLRLDASRALRRAGYRYLLVATGSGGNTPIGNIIVGHEAEWGMERVGEAGRFYLLRVK